MDEKMVWYAQQCREAVKKWKQDTGKKVFGYFCCLAPEEILYAADVLPIRITGTGEPLKMADMHVPPNTCPFARSCLDAGIRGMYDYLDGVVIPNSCDIIFAMEYFWKTLVPRPTKAAIISGMDIKPYVYYINYPTKTTGRKVVPYYLQVLNGFRQSLERALNRTISEDDLTRSVAVYNLDKAQMKRMYDMRRSDPPVLTGFEAWQIAFSGLLMPKDAHAALLKEYLDEIESSGRTSSGGVRIYLSGTAMDDVNAEIFKVIEDCGGQVVSDDLCVGTRSFWNSISTDVPPMEAIARRSLATACPRSTVIDPIPENRWTHIENTVEDFNIEGAIFLVLKCCDARLSEYPHLRDKFKKELGIPVLFLEGDYTVESIKTMSGRIEAFIEMIGG